MMRLLRFGLFVCTILAFVPPIAGVAVYAHYAEGLPELPPMATFYEGLATPTTVHDANGLLLAEFAVERRTVTPLHEMPVTLVAAFLAAEDERFFEHHGVDPRGVARALVANLTAGRIVQGASTITQQLAKTMLSNAKSYERKIREAILSRRMEDVYSKRDILTLYLNQIYLGHGAHGVAAAARNYFRKRLHELTLAEMATLAVLPPSPSVVNPIRNMDKTLERRRHVLERMVALGSITQAEALEANAVVPRVFPIENLLADRAPYVAMHGRQSLREALGDAADAKWRQGYRVDMAVETDLQQDATRALSTHLEELDRKQGYRGPVDTVDLAEIPALLVSARDYYLDRGLLVDDEAVDGHVYLGFVTGVTKDGMDLSILPDTATRLSRRSMKWAGPYKAANDNSDSIEGDDATERTRGPKTSPKVSWKPVLKDCRDAFDTGDVVLVRKQADGFSLYQQPGPQGAALAWDPRTGYVRATVGGSDWERSNVDRVRSLRQTGSTMKPVYYALAYELGMRPSYPMSDAPYRRGTFSSTGGSSDATPMMVYDGLVKSRNTVSLRISEYVEHALARRDRESLAWWSELLGLSRPLLGGRAEILGGDQTLWDMSGAFGRFRSGGLHVARHLTTRILAPSGDALLDERFYGDPGLSGIERLRRSDAQLGRRRPRVLHESVAWLMQHNLSRVVRRGTATRARKALDREAAGKTGSLPYDIWFNGFTRDLVTTVWVGADRRERILGRSKRSAGVYGAGPPLSTFIDVVRLASAGRPPRPVVGKRPSSIELVTVDPETGNRTMTGGVSLPHRAAYVPTVVEHGEASTDDVQQTQTEF